MQKRYQAKQQQLNKFNFLQTKQSFNFISKNKQTKFLKKCKNNNLDIEITRREITHHTLTQTYRAVVLTQTKPKNIVNCEMFVFCFDL
jgi:hypothetical protein